MAHRNPLEQNNPIITKQRTEAVNHRGYCHIEHHPTEEGEAMPVYFPRGLPEIVLGYLDNDINSIQQPNRQTKWLSQQCGQFKLFGRTLTDLMSDEAATVGNLILRGEEKNVNDALALVKKKPILLYCQTEATDPLKRRVKGTLLQIAAMAGDVDLKPGIREEKDRGMVERLIAVGRLSQEEVVEQLKVIIGEAAQHENEARNQCVLAAIIKFGNSICEVKSYDGMSLVSFQARCKPIIDELEIALQPDTKGVISSGYVFDLKILQYAAKWFEDNVKKFGGWWTNQSDAFWVNGFGKLQSKLSSRDAQVVNIGVGRVVDQGKLPLRTLNSGDGVSHFYDANSRLGIEFCLGDFGGCGMWGPARGSWVSGKLMSSKNDSIAKLIQCPDNRSRFESCLVM